MCQIKDKQAARNILEFVSNLLLEMEEEAHVSSKTHVFLSVVFFVYNLCSSCPDSQARCLSARTLEKTK